MQVIDGIELRIINVKIDNTQSLLRRLWTYFIYMLFSCWFALRLPADLVIVSSGPISVGLPGLIAKYLRRKKLVFEVRDLWPQGVIELGIIKSGFLKHIFYWFEGVCYKSSKLIVSLSPGIRDNIISRFPYLEVISVTNPANLKLFQNNGYHDRLPQEIINMNYAIYTGNIGEVNNSYLLFETAIELKKCGREDILMVLVGDGQQKLELLNKAKEMQIDNFIILDLLPKEKLVPYLQRAVASIIPLKDKPVFATSSPNKFFESLAAGVPVIQTTTGWLKDLVSNENIGFNVEANNPKMLSDLLIEMVNNPETYKDYRKRARLVAEKYFDKDKLAQTMLDALIKVHNN